MNNHMKKLLLPIIALLLTAGSCTSSMDPFEGTDGIRFNLNGKKYVMQSGLLGLDPLVETEDGRIVKANMQGPSFLDLVSFTLNLCKADQLAVDKEYKTGENGISATIKPYVPSTPTIAAVEEDTTEPKEEVKPETPPVQLQGWVKRVASETDQLEILFEFTGKDTEGNEFVIKHGFLRL